MTAQVKDMNAALLADFLQGGSEYLGLHKEEINALNVFPVPDGDTGINMHLTINGASKNIAGKSYAAVAELGADFAMGALMGARGNSGVILSQIFRGFSLGLQGKKSLNAVDFAQALQKGVDLSYKSVMKPVEGTILTVFRYFAAEAVKCAKADGDLIELIELALKAGEKSLADTPNLLPVLKEAGVVDAGGKGLLMIMEGGLKVLKGEVFSAPAPVAPISIAQPMATPAATALDLEFIYCTECLIKGQNIPLDTIRDRLAEDQPGDSLLVVGTAEMVKVHFHNNAPWQMLGYCAQFGTLHDIKIDNMLDQAGHHAAPAESIAIPASAPIEAAPPQVDMEPCQTGVIAICAGDGLAEIFASMGVQVLAGGQTMNPSAEDILTAINANNGAEVIILPNNSNIILAAEQAQKLADKPVYVVPSKFVTQGISALLAYDKNAPGEQNAAAMTEAIAAGINCELTYAVRNTKLNGINIKKDDILALKDGQIIATGKKLETALTKLLDKALAEDNDYSIISFYYGNNLPEKQAAEIAEKLAKKYPSFDVEYHYGGQPLYYLLLAVE